MRRIIAISFAVWLSVGVPADAAVTGTIVGTVLDPQGHPVEHAEVTLGSSASEWRQRAESDATGGFSLSAVPAGEYRLVIRVAGFEAWEHAVLVRSGVVTSVPVSLRMAGVGERVEVRAESGEVNIRSLAATTLVTRRDLADTPGALRSNSLAMVTQFVPGSYLVHDQLHIRGGHQVSWLVDGVPVPNTNIANTVGPQFDPRDIEAIEIHRGGYSAEFGDRTYGVFNVQPRTGFERNREAEIVASYGTHHDADAQVSVGDHSDAAAYYASVTGNRTDVGLEPPVPDPLHDGSAGLSAYGSVVARPTTRDELRVVAAVRGDHYDIPNTPEDQEAGVANQQRERDVLINTSWRRTLGSRALVAVSPFYHFTRAAFDGRSNGTTVDVTDHRDSSYAGLQAVVSLAAGAHAARAGVYGFHQRDTALFALQTAAPAVDLRHQQAFRGHLEAVFAEEQYTMGDRVTLSGGLRATWFSGLISETAVDPRLAAAVQLPAAMVLRGSYGRYYQAPPLSTLDGPLLDVAIDAGFGFLPLEGERDEQYEVGLTVPVRGWVGEAGYFHTRARNFFDHEALGNSNIFVPVTIEAARIRGTEVTVRSPRLGPTEVHLAYAHLHTEGRGGVSGGLTDFEPAEEEGYYYLDHDQRHTLAVGATTALPGHASISASVEYGSGFLAGDGPAHNPGHTTWNLQATKSFSDRRWSLVVSVLNLTDSRFLLDESNTFGGTHYNPPRQISFGGRYRFRY